MNYSTVTELTNNHNGLGFESSGARSYAQQTVYSEGDRAMQDQEVHLTRNLIYFQCAKSAVWPHAKMVG